MAETGTTGTSVIDVREAIKDLEEHGLTGTQASGIVIFHLKTTENHVATKWDLRVMEARIKARLTEVQVDLFKWLIVAQFVTAALVIAIIKHLP